jgi:hypothetical protein
MLPVAPRTVILVSREKGVSLIELFVNLHKLVEKCFYREEKKSSLYKL